MNTDIGINEKGKNEIIEGLNIYLANLHVLYTKLHNYHWNVEGKSFFQLHSKLEELYTNYATEIDEVAERILQLGGRPAASMKEYLELAQFQEAPSKKYTGDEVVNALLDDFTKMCKILREGIKLAEQYKDEVTVDMAVGTLANLEKNIWMLKAFLS